MEDQERIDNILKKLTLDEKFHLLSGNRFFSTRQVKRLKIKPFKMTDGPFGVAMHSSVLRKNTRFPGGICLAATWNRDLSEKFGVAVGEETRACGRHSLLGPGININRTPLNGRTFEYFSEDPFLNTEMAIPFVQGVQSQRVAACIKHYVANNQETNRSTVSAEIDERTLHEIYLKSFKGVIENSDPWMVMTSYNKVNGKYLFENKELLKDILNEWHFSGFVVSDWLSLARSTPPVSPEDCIKAGLSLEMPMANKYVPEVLMQAYKDGTITDDDLNYNLERLLRVMFLVGLFDDKATLPKGKRNTPEHQELARKMAEDGMVLLKNENNLLPLDETEITKIAVIGPNRDKKFGKLLYGGSSAVKPPYEITPLKGLREKCKGKVNIINDPVKADIVLLFAGLNHDSEGKLVRGDNDKIYHGNDTEVTDRAKLDLPDEQIDLINRTAKANPNTVVVLLNGSPLAMDSWLKNVPAVLEAWYPGMEGGRAIANVLFGDVNPSGKLPLTFPKSLSDSPAHKSGKSFPGEDRKVYYSEGIFVGYRYFDNNNVEPLFPFGHGLSYTTFALENLRLDKEMLMSSDDSLKINLDVINTGSRFGAEVVQVYVQDLECSVERPPKELVGFEKVYLHPGERKTAEIELKAKDLAFYDVTTRSWQVEPGKFKLLIGTSSRDIHLQKEIVLTEV
ncbi:MAG: beta-glucosidase [Candidatus Odinarchaeota archaeon]